LQDSEKAINKAGDEIVLIFSELAKIRDEIKILTNESVRARDAADKLAVLDEAVPLLEKRIAEMQVAREWLARTETQMLALDKEAQNQLRLTASLLNQEGNKISAGKGGKGAPPIRSRENIIKLHKQGFKIEEIAKLHNMSIGEVELILELGIPDSNPKK